jgi:hypothetical protein
VRQASDTRNDSIEAQPVACQRAPVGGAAVRGRMVELHGSGIVEHGALQTFAKVVPPIDGGQIAVVPYPFALRIGAYAADAAF